MLQNCWPVQCIMTVFCHPLFVDSAHRGQLINFFLTDTLLLYVPPLLLPHSVSLQGLSCLLADDTTLIGLFVTACIQLVQSPDCWLNNFVVTCTLAVFKQSPSGYSSRDMSNNDREAVRCLWITFHAPIDSVAYFVL
jgi:hypothetical protein